MQATRALGSSYVLEELLGSGAMGQVWVAVDTRTGERLAAKLLREEFTRDPEIIGRFVQERSILLGLDHPHVVRVRDLVVEGDALAIVMDLVEGSDLRRRLRDEGTLAPAEAVRVTCAVLAALAAAHERGILHRDVKPDNVLLGPDDAVLLSDFSIARLAQETTVRMTGVLGTAEYIAPEVFESEQVSAAADVYGAGTVLYELLAGRTPFAGASTGGGTGFAVANRHVRSLPPELPGLPVELRRWLLAMLEKDPTRRPTAAAAAGALAALVPGLTGVPALPRQEAPAAWAAVDVAAAPLEPRVAGHVPGAAPDLDPGRTTIRAAAPAAAATPAPVVDGEARWAGPEGADVDLSQTTVRAVPRTPRPRVDDAVPSVEATPAPSSRRRRLLVVGGVGAAVAAVAATAVLVLGGEDSAPRTTTPPVAVPETITAALPPQLSASGLTTTREAAYDPAAGTLTTTVTWTAGATALMGPFYEVVPPASPGAACPEVAWDSTALRDTTEAISRDACGWRVAVTALRPGDRATASHTAPLKTEQGKEVAQLLRERLAAGEQATLDALTGLAVTPVYPAQRLAGLAVDVDGTVTVGSAVSLRVLPVWLGESEPDNVNVLLTSSSGAPSGLLRQLGGSLSVSTDDCSGALAFRGGRPYANTVGRDCTITARLGSLAESSRSFDITQRSA